MRVTRTKKDTYRDNLSTNSDGFISGKCQILSICEETHVKYKHAHTVRRRQIKLVLSCFSCVKLEHHGIYT